jgi:5-methylcytosine-specific restriction enzyme subunit McrC
LEKNSLILKSKHISIFEHDSIYTNRGDHRISDSCLKALQNFHGDKGVPYYSLINNGVRFCEYVGVLQIGDTIIEVLPKADRNADIKNWKGILISMLKAVGVFNIHAPSSSSLELKSNSILDLYFELFIKEVQYLMQRGLIKKYRKVEGNKSALKGQLDFAKQIQQNLVHKERFYVKHSVYDNIHKVHSILFKTLNLLQRINTNSSLMSHIGSLILDFPEVPDITVTEKDFQRIEYDRKLENYRNALEISRLLLLNYHPDIKTGKENLLALMFDMNLLWEQFVYISIRKHRSKDFRCKAQYSKDFWKPEMGHKSRLRPDIVISNDEGENIVLDTKWKNLNGQNPSVEDLRQMYVYSNYYNASKVGLIYPGSFTGINEGNYYDEYTDTIGDAICSLISIGVEKNIKNWQQNIFKEIMSWGFNSFS